MERPQQLQKIAAPDSRIIGVRRADATSNDGYIVVKLKRDAEAVEARTQIRGARRDVGR